MQGSQIEAAGNLTAQAADIHLLARTDRTETAYELGQPLSGKGVYAKGESLSETATGSRLGAQGTIILDAGTGTLSSEGARVQAGQDLRVKAGDIWLDAAYDRSSNVETYSQVAKRGQQQSSRNEQTVRSSGSLFAAGRHLDIASSGNTTLTGSALAAGQAARLSTTGDLALLAAQSTIYRDINASSQNSKKATMLRFNEQEVRQLLSTITVGSGLELNVGGNFSAHIGDTSPDGKALVDRMTPDGIVRGDSRQQVSVSRTGVGADARPTQSQVLGDP